MTGVRFMLSLFTLLILFDHWMMPTHLAASCVQIDDPLSAACMCSFATVGGRNAMPKTKNLFGA